MDDFFNAVIFVCALMVIALWWPAAHDWAMRLKAAYNAPPPELPKDTRFTCTYCGGDQFYEGPSGGMSTNILCANIECRHWFNDHGGIIPPDDLNRVEPRENME